MKAVGGKVYIAPLDVVLDDANVVQPDVLWIAPEGAHCSVDETTGRLRGAPDLVVEVLSPTSGYRDRRTKFRLYELHDVREYWLVDPREKLITVWTLREGRYELLDTYAENETFTAPLVGTVAAAALFSA
ncbi:MAG: Uma2 family endonuclease [Anaerolineae bacterium]|nr:Uma2 family endonuclease [Anaerolineae bacterium]NUQ06557.1 Uma2 family endonuclease [Anaerolineae bacterium]